MIKGTKQFILKNRRHQMNADEIRLTVIKAMFTVPQLEDILTLKGGNAMKLQGLTDRQSQDLDFSIKENIRLSIEQDGPLFLHSLQNEFNQLGYQVVGFTFEEKPSKRTRITPPYWGGYQIEFSIVSEDVLNHLSEAQLKNKNAYAESIENGKKRLQIDLSFDEYTEPRIKEKIDSVDIYLYSPLMIIYEKIRASCQQLPHYTLGMNKKRARDLFDIYTILTNIKYVDLYDEVLSSDNLYIIRKMFALKEVPLDLIPKIEEIKEELREDYESKVIPQVPGNQPIPDFDYLFAFNNELFMKLYTLLQ